MPARHTLIALFSVVAWAANFPVTVVALEQFTPMLIVALRYSLVALPTLVFVRPPTGVWKWLVAYGLVYGVFQFGAVYWGIRLGTPSGVASVLIQSSAPFTVLFGAAILKERATAPLMIGLAAAVAGLAGITIVGGAQFGVLPAILVILGGAGWAMGNIIVRRSRTTEIVRFSLWMSTVPPIPAFLLGLWIDGADASFAGFRGLTTTTGLKAMVALVYIGLIATFAATAAWLYVLSRNPAGKVAPLTLLMPVVAILIGWWALDETPSPVVSILIVIIMVGVAVTTVPGTASRTHPRWHTRTRCELPTIHRWP